MHETVFTDDAVATRGPVGGVEYRYAHLGAVEERGPLVLIRPAGARGGLVSPRELFPDVEVDRVRRAIAGSGPRVA